MRNWFQQRIQARRCREAPSLGPPGDPPGFDFDSLAKDLAAGLSRRDALRRLGTGLAVAVLAGLGLDATVSAAPSACNSYCKACSGTANRQCSDACLACAANPNNLCGPCGAKVCRNLASDLNNCGACGNICPTLPNSIPTCVNGRCGFRCDPGYSPCGSTSTVSGCAINLTNDVGNCGACRNSCPVPANTTPTCTNGVCGSVCRAGYANCNGNPADGCEVYLLTDVNHCGACGHQCPFGESCANGHCTCGTSGSDCPGDEVCCGGFCRNTLVDVSNCGACGISCTGPPQSNATPVCANGRCGYLCTAPFADCNGLASDGCETNTSNDRNNCGGCGNVCQFPNASAACIGGTCQIATCTTGYANCDGNAGSGCEVHLLTDSRNCGACGNRCALGASCRNGNCVCDGGGIPCAGVCCAPGQVCAGGTCVCPSGQTLCGGSCCSGICCGNTCANPTTDDNNCGACGNQCSKLNEATSAGGLVREFHCCGGTCVDVLNNDGSHCGSCTGSCNSGQICQGGACVCPSGQTECGASCADLTTDPDNCGACGNRCASGASCNSGICVCDNSGVVCAGVCCAPGQICVEGACVCPSGQTLCGGSCCSGICCGGTCTNPKTDDNNCGACGNQCSSLNQSVLGIPLATFHCCGGTCIDILIDNRNCGVCGYVCPAFTTCRAGVCLLF